MSSNNYYIKLESSSSTGYFLNIFKTDVKLVDDMKDACQFNSLESAQALIDYVLPSPLIGSWKVVKHGSI